MRIQPLDQTTALSPTPRRFWAAAVAVMVVALAACAAPPPAMFTFRVPDPGPADTIPLNLTPTPVPDLVEVNYGTGPRQQADVFLPRAGGNRGVIIAVHGGGFTSGSRADVPAVFGPVLAQTSRGFSVVAIDYRLAAAQTNLFPTAVFDVAAAVNWVRASGPAVGLNPATVVLAGHSAGGTLASLVALAANTTTPTPFGPLPPVDGWLSFGAIYDFVDASPKVASFGIAWLGSGWSLEGRAVASPKTYIDPSDPPGFAVHGNIDNIVDATQFTRFVETAATRGVTTRLYADYVDTDAGGGVCRWHMPMCGANATVMSAWLDAVAGRAL